MVTFIWWALRRGGIRLSDLLGGRWTRPAYFLRDLGLGIAYVLVFGGGALARTQLPA
jgi:hypothetical protein